MLASRDFQYCKFCQQENCLSNCEKHIRKIFDYDNQEGTVVIEMITYICPNDHHNFYKKICYYIK